MKFDLSILIITLTISVVLSFTFFLPIGLSIFHMAFNAFAVPVIAFLIYLQDRNSTIFLLGLLGISLKRGIGWVIWASYTDQWDDGAGLGVVIVFWFFEIVTFATLTAIAWLVQKRTG